MFGDRTLDNPEQEKLIREVKSNIWMPESPDDFEKLQPTMIFTDDSEEIEQLLLDGTTAKQKTKRSDLPERWNTVRTFISTMKNNANIGRNLNFLVADNIYFN